MDLQYISDTNGRQTAVVIPIEDWHNLTKTYEGLKTLEDNHKGIARKKPSDFVGCISKEIAQKMITDIEISRKQWERDI